MKRFVSLMLVVIIVMGITCNETKQYVYAATTTQDHGFTLDENLFDVNWNETNKVYVKQNVRSCSAAFDKGVTLGYVSVSAGFATSKRMIDGKFYQRILLQSKMVPQTVSGNNKGMSQYLKVQVCRGEKMLNTIIEPQSSSGSTSYTTTGNMSSGSTLGVGVNSKGEYTLNGSSSYTMGMSSSISYTRNALIVITNEDDNGYAVWNYDYVSSSSNKEQNAYLFGSSTQYGLFSWNMEKNLNAVYGETYLTVTATFGGGNTSTNVRYTPWNNSKNYHLGTQTKTMTINY